MLQRQVLRLKSWWGLQSLSISMFDLSLVSFCLLPDNRLFSWKMRISLLRLVLMLSSTSKLMGILFRPSIMLTTPILAAITFRTSSGTFIPGEWLGQRLHIFGISSKLMLMLSSCCAHAIPYTMSCHYQITCLCLPFDSGNV
jgi:hypothetical protein